MGKNHLSASAMQGGKAEPKKEKSEIVDEFVVQLISDPEKKNESCQARWGVLLECARINLSLFRTAVRKSHSNVAPGEHSSRCFLCVF